MLKVDPSAVDDVGSEILDIHCILGPEHLASTNSIQDTRLIFGQVGLQHLDCHLGLIGTAGRAVLLQADGLELLQNRLLLCFPGRLEGLETEVDGFGDLFLGEFAVNVGGSLDDCEGINRRF